MPAFHEVRFPLAVGFGATGGPMFRTEIVTLASGHEARNARWSRPLRRFDAGTGLRDLDDLAEVVAFFEERRGRLHGFRFRDPADHLSCLPSGAPTPADQLIGIGDGETPGFQLVKAYGEGATAATRPIVKPVAGSVRVAVGGTEMAKDEDFSVDVATGLVTFAAESIPAADAAVTAGFAFDVPVRFDTDEIRIDLAAFAAGEIPSIPLIEVRLP